MSAPLPPLHGTPSPAPPPGLGWAVRAGWSMLERVRGERTLSILVLHRVHARQDPLFPSELDAARFDRLLAHLAQNFNVMSVGRAARALAAGMLPPRALAISFDDGYADHAEVALPLLRRHGLEATFFVCTGFLGGGCMWNDTVIETFRRARLESIDLRRLGLGRLPLGSMSQRRAAIDAVLPIAKYRNLDAREELLAVLAELAGKPPLPERLMMDEQQLRAVASAGMEIGAHTVHHPILTEISLSQAEREIVESRDMLRSLTGSAVDVMAYPNGRPFRDYDAGHVALVRRLGFFAAVSTAAGAATAGADMFQLPRFTAWDRGLWAWSARVGANASLRTFVTV